jgi:hypothetical protein
MLGIDYGFEYEDEKQNETKHGPIFKSSHPMRKQMSPDLNILK